MPPFPRLRIILRLPLTLGWALWNGSESPTRLVPLYLLQVSLRKREKSYFDTLAALSGAFRFESIFESAVLQRRRSSVPKSATDEDSYISGSVESRNSRHRKGTANPRRSRGRSEERITFSTCPAAGHRSETA